ncbi:formate hydrogenlyase maturation protein HycH [Thermanaeromonas toyohensis ToBE]|uniref:Formate hydrogenlyase maturation protein HycH n=1 Tax=Thermanaeromonas toyohensis ToBE TaxID=698762 RepID=A0A1W1VH60_9FIRM|nr:formate hydrogenlyase maturation HycH family protein [Thermanaeromonas toyohensis]SMB92719.1 formate hydrogenlyase maturation protein HycH [Thermanaeromonas toyohensis ToBE]
MPGKVKFFKLCKRFVDEKDAPPEVKQLEYYALALGHHIGVVDCLSPVMVMEEKDYFKWISKLPQGKARSKLEGLSKWGELEINREHVAPLVSALVKASPSFLPEEKKWADCLLQLLQSIQKEPAIYLVVRLSEGASDYCRQRADG